MTARLWAGAVACIAGLTAWTEAPGPRRYRVDLKTFVVQDLTIIGQGEQKQEFSHTGFVTVTTRDSGGGETVTLVLDSMIAGPGSPISAEAAKGAAGTTWRGFREPGGRLREIQPDSANSAVGAIEPALRQLFPPMRSGTGAGQTWTDTTDSDNEGIVVRTVTNYQTSGDSYEGARVVRLAGAFSAAMSGQQASPQGPLNIEGTGTGTHTWFVSADGTCLSATYSANQNLSISVAQLPEPIPVSVKTEGSATLLK